MAPLNIVIRGRNYPLSKKDDNTYLNVKVKWKERSGSDASDGIKVSSNSITSLVFAFFDCMPHSNDALL